MEKEELIKIANVVSSIFLLDQDVEIEEIIKRLKLIGRIIKNNVTKEQEQSFKSWIINILKNRLEKEERENIGKLLEEISEMEVDDMVSNLGRKLEEEFKYREKKGKKEGIKEGKYEVVKNLIKMGLDLKMIAEGAGISYEEVMKIKEEIEKEKH